MAGDRDTIFALSSGRPPAGIAVVRVSGPRAGAALEALAGGTDTPRRARLATLREPVTGEHLDRALVLWLPGPGTATGEDVAELHVHGGRAVISAVLGALARLGGLRPAEPGEFTRRAFGNGVMDLAAVEGLADLIAAETDGQRRQALRQTEGALGAAVARWRDDLIAAMALVEAAIDFPDEGDVPTDPIGPARARVAGLVAEIDATLADARRGERMRDGFAVALAGAPNAGKSSLLNALARRDVAIVSDVPGTTRDALEVHLDLGGVPVTLIDTAGLRETDDPLEGEGVRRARRRLEAADLVLWLVAPDLPGGAPPSGGASVWTVATKADLGMAAAGARHRVSIVSGAGLDGLVGDLARAAALATDGEPALVTRERQRLALTDAHAALSATLGISESEPELIGETLRLAARALGRVVGAVDVEDVLDALFRQFCIGK